MAKSFKYKNNMYLDTKGIVHNQKILADMIYPVGSIYMSVNSTNPKNIFGGTWEQIKDRFLLAVGDTYKTVNATGGNSSINIQHRHSFNLKGQSSYALNSWGLHIVGPSGTDGVSNADIYTNYQGSTSQSIIPPYLTVYIWKRTA